MVSKLIIGTVLLLILASVAAEVPLIIEKDGFYYEDHKVSFIRRLFLPVQQSVIESSVTSGQKATADTTVSAKLIYIPKYDAENFAIDVYLYDTKNKRHFGPLETIQGGMKRNKGSRYEGTIQFKPGTFLGSQFGSYYGVVGVLKLQVKKEVLSASDVSKAVCQKNNLCWIIDKYNEVGGIQTNVFSPPFLYYEPNKICQKGYIGEPSCKKDANIFRIYQNYKTEDCSVQLDLKTTCSYGYGCENGKCIASSCKLAGQNVGNECVDGILNNRVYDENCKIKYIPIKFSKCGEQEEPTLPDPCAKGQCNTVLPSCQEATANCLGGGMITISKCDEFGNVLPTGESCPTDDGDFPPVLPPSGGFVLKQFAKNNPLLFYGLIIGIIILLALAYRRNKQ